MHMISFAYIHYIFFINLDAVIQADVFHLYRDLFYFLYIEFDRML